MFSANTSQVSSEANWIESCFSSYLYTGNASTQNIVNGIDLAGKGGMVWGKARNDTGRHVLFDTARGVLNELSSNLTNAQTNHAASLTAFNSNGYTLGNDDWTNYSTTFNSVSWTFRKQEKFFDVVTYTGDGNLGRTVSHNLGSTPGCIIVKDLSQAASWVVYHRSAGGDLFLNTTGAAGAGYSRITSPTSTTFTVSDSASVNGSGDSYVAYLFAHDAGGFGISGTDNVITCGSWTGSAADINLGYEPQWLLVKKNVAGWPWYIIDNMRGLYADPTSATYLLANTSAAETSAVNIKVTSTGFTQAITSGSESAIYIAIRRGPMKIPTSGTSVFEPSIYSGNDVYPTTIGSLPVVDLAMPRGRGGSGWPQTIDRLRGGSIYSFTSNTNAESNISPNYEINFDNQTGLKIASQINTSGTNYVNYSFRRSPSFMDVVCYSGNSTAGTTQAHNSGVVPQLIIVKNRTTASNWAVYSETTGASRGLTLNTTASQGGTNPYLWNSTAPTASVFSLGDDTRTNETGSNYVAYLFASCAGVSKVGSYSGTGATQTISCGFAVRFVLIKRTDSTGNWWVWDTARGMVAGTDPRLAQNTTDAETNTNWVYTDASGFQIVTTDATVNASGGSYIYLAIA